MVDLQKPASAALVGKIDAFPVNGSFSDIGASAPNAEDFSQAISDEVSNIYIAQLYNSTVHYFRTGMTDSPGLGSLLIFDYANGTYDWDLTLDLDPNPASAQLRVFKSLYDQPVLLDLVPNDAFAPNVSSYTGREWRQPHLPRPPAPAVSTAEAGETPLSRAAAAAAAAPAGFTQEELNAGLATTGAYDLIPDGVPTIFNVTPPVV